MPNLRPRKLTRRDHLRRSLNRRSRQGRILRPRKRDQRNSAVARPMLSSSSPLVPPPSFELLVGEESVGQRLDFFLAQKFPTHSRVQLRRAINAAGVEVNGS